MLMALFQWKTDEAAQHFIAPAPTSLAADRCYQMLAVGSLLSTATISVF
jgi:hypothetical protein